MDRSTIENMLVSQALKGSDLSGNWGHTSEQRRGVGRGGSDPGGGLRAIGADYVMRGIPPNATLERSTLEERRRYSEQHRRTRALLQPVPSDQVELLARSIRGVQHGTQWNGKERAFGLDESWGAVSGVAIGDDHSVDVGPMLDREATFLVHTHPGDAPPSPDDIAVIIAFPQVQHSVIVGTGGTLYRLSRTPDTVEGVRKPTPQQYDQAREFIARLWGQNADAAYPALQRALPGHVGETQESKRKRWHEAIHYAVAEVARATHLDYQRIMPGELT